jgi:glycosyltransferase involved in cell wall biosynthesis
MIGRPALGSWQNEILKKIRRLPNMEYRGELSIDQVNALLQKSHILVNTSDYEGFPNTYIQAWMRKVPVVALNSDPDDFIKTQEIGFHSKTFKQMVLDVRSLLENKPLREKMGEKSCEFSRKMFSGSQIDNFLNLIDEV